MRRPPGPCCTLVLGLLVLLAPVNAVALQATLRDEKRYVVVELPTLTPRMSLVGAITPRGPDAYASEDRVLVNVSYFDQESGWPAGKIRQNGSNVADDRRIFGTVLKFGKPGSGWQLVPPGQEGNAENVIQVGPTLVREGRVVLDAEMEGVHPDAESRARRTAFAIRGGSTLIIATREEMTLPEFADFTLRLGVTEAVNLDGGSSTCLVWRKLPIVSSGRKIPFYLAFDIDEATAARPAPEVRTVTIAPGSWDVKRIVLRPGETPHDVQVRTGAAVVVAPDPVEPPGVHPPPGFFVGFDQDGEAFFRPCSAGEPASCRAWARGPLIVAATCGLSLREQGYEEEPSPRMAVAIMKDGSTAILTRDEGVPLAEWQRRLRPIARTAVGLACGDGATLYADGRWIVEPRRPVPCVIALIPRPAASPIFPMLLADLLRETAAWLQDLVQNSGTRWRLHA